MTTFNYGLVYMTKLYGPNAQTKVGNLSSQTTNIISEENKLLKVENCMVHPLVPHCHPVGYVRRL